MPYINLVIAQGVAGWIAPWTLTDILMAAMPNLEPWRGIVIALLTGASSIIGGAIGAQISPSLPRPAFGQAIITLLAAVAGAVLASIFLAPDAEASELKTHLATFAPVAASIAAYALTARPTRTLAS